MRFSKIFAAAFAFMLAGCGECINIEVSNPLNVDRHPEIVEIPAEEVTSLLSLEEGEQFVIRKGREEVPYQLTYDGKVIFPVTAAASQTQTFRLRKGTPSECVVKVCGKHYPERVDDICWENDLTGYRVYGYKDDSPSGYDFFTKRNTDLPVIDQMYKMALDPERKKIRQELQKIDKDSADRYNSDHMSFHVDHGFGADCYGVGKTLGAGVAALLDGEEIVYPFCYETYEILENGPLRFTLKLTFRPFDVEEFEDVVETRIMTLDLGSHFTKTAVSYSGIDRPMPIVSGIVVQDMDGKAVGNAEKGYIAYPAPTINADRQRDVDNGTIFVGNVFPDPLEAAGLKYFPEEDSKARGGAKGHILAHTVYNPETPFVYYWGFGWDHADITSYEQWLEHIDTFTAQLKTPLIVTIK